MTEAIAPFHRLRQEAGRGFPAVLRLMRLHFTIVGLGLLLSAISLMGYLYFSEFRRVDIGWNLRITRSAEVYQYETQIQFVLAIILALLSLIMLRTVSHLSERQHGGLLLARTASLISLAGFPLSFVLWRQELDLSVIPVDVTQLGLRVASVIFFAQSILGLWYLVRLSSGNVRRTLMAPDVSTHSPLRRVRTAGMGLWLLVLLGLGLALAVVTDFIELPLARPEPGELLYATSFDAFHDEWDIYAGRDSAQLVSVDELEKITESALPLLAGDVLVVSYGSPYTNEVVFSSVDRKFNDLDLRVTAQQVSGPDDNQFGVVFRYHDLNNYYAFMISGNGYYSLVKNQAGQLEEISAWGLSDVIRQGVAANEVRVVSHEDEFMFYVNGQLMPLCLRGDNRTSMWTPGDEPGVCFTDEVTYIYKDDDFKQGRVALAAGSSVDLSDAVTVAFDDLVIVGSDSDQMSVPEATNPS